ncbi:histidine kinase [Microbacterium sp. NPDC057407]|uniref:histidine kinase n=1 Tax=Microbacterium sp. NPDC057407 TaxID=3346120 RepID=UPI00366C8696
MRTTPLGRIAGALVTLEGVGLVALTVWQIVAIAGGDTSSIDSALALIVLSAVGAAAVIAFGVAVWRGRSWGRSGGIVVQLLILAVALGAATGAYAEPTTALLLAAPAVVVLVLLVLAVREAAPRR